MAAAFHVTWKRWKKNVGSWRYSWRKKSVQMKGLNCFRKARCTVLYNSILFFIRTPLKNIRFWADMIYKNEEEISLFTVFATFFLSSSYAEVLKRLGMWKDSILKDVDCIESFSVYFGSVLGTEKLHNTVYPRDQHLLRRHPGTSNHCPSEVPWDTIQSSSCFILLFLYCLFLY